MSNQHFWKYVVALVGLFCTTHASAITATELAGQGATPLSEAEIQAVTQDQTLDHKMLGTRLVAPIEVARFV